MLLEKTQRRLCRAVFVLGCVLPTLAVAGFATARLRPSYVGGVLAAVGERLRAEVDCDDLQTPRPGLYVVKGVRLADLASEEEFLTCDELRLDLGARPPRFAARNVAVRRPADAWLLQVLQSDCSAEGQATRLVVGEACYEQVSVELRHGSLKASGNGGANLTASIDEGVCRVAFDSASQAVEADWLSYEPLNAVSSQSARFRGKAFCSVPVDGADAKGEAAGHFAFAGLSLAGLTASHGTLAAEELRWAGPRVERLAGRLELREGQVTRPLIYGMCRWLTMEPFAALEARWADPATAEIPFTQLACEVELDAKGLTLVAGCGELDGETRGGAVSHAVLEHRGEPLLKQPQTRPLPVQRLVQAWRPDDVAELPATAEAIEMASRLPGMTPK
jgi:hypothetical protein